MDLPTIQQLRYLVNLSDCGSFHAAAAACYVSQSTLSTGIKNLETQLGVLLVDRSNRVLVFTEVGEQVVQIARDVLEKASDIVLASMAGHDLLTGNLKVGSVPTILPFVVVELMSRVKESYPELTLSLTEGTTSNLVEKLQQGRLDVLILALPYKEVERENLNTMPLFKDRFHFAYHHSMAAVMKGNGGDAKKLPPNDLLLMAEGHCLRGHALNACSMRKSSRVNTYEISSLQTLKGLVNSGVGYSYFPEVAVEAGWLEGTDIITEPLEASRTISLVWRKSSSRDEEFKLFGELFTGTKMTQISSPQSNGADHG